ncbi:fer-1-like protein 6 isoform X2 [Clytia hemisphaerica]|uniref:fer-1-like protein 6 isoform X2 n=1 Tax=Clytia hemisphaerica TaxID=252671 RepID=UPI0034D69140
MYRYVGRAVYRLGYLAEVQTEKTTVTDARLTFIKENHAKSKVSLNFTIHYQKIELKRLLEGENSDKSDCEEEFYFATSQPMMEQLRKVSSSSLLNAPAPNVRPKTPILHHRTFDEELVGSSVNLKFPELYIHKLDEWQVCAYIHEARELVGSDISPKAEVKILQDFSLPKNVFTTSSMEKTNNPVWEYPFNTSKESVLMEQFLDATFNISIYSGSNLIGSCKFDLWTAYRQPGHCFIRKWVEIRDKDMHDEKRGYVLLSLATFQQDGHHEEWLAPCSSSTEKHDIQSNLLFPMEEELCLYNVFIYEGEHLLNKNSSNPYLKVNYGSKSVSEITRVKEYKAEGSVSEESGKDTMKFHKRVSFVGYHPPRIQNMRIQVVNQRGPISNDQVVATASINMIQASFFDDDVTENDHDDAFACDFGPTWLHLYGSCSESDNKESINNGYGQGHMYNGRLLVRITTEQYGYAPLEELHKVQEIETKEQTRFHHSTKEFLLFATIFDANMIEFEKSHKHFHFELSIGHKREDNRGKASWQTDRYKPEEISNNSQYCSLNFNSEGHTHKPCMHLMTTLPDLLFRINNNVLMKKIVMRFEEEVVMALTKFEHRTDSKAKTECCTELEKIIHSSLNELRGILEEKMQTDSHINHNKLDVKIKKKRIKLRKSLKSKSDELIKSWNDRTFEEIKFDMDFILDQLKILASEPQHSFPDVILLMCSDKEPIGYARIPVEEIISMDGSRGGFVRTILLRAFHGKKERHQDLVKGKLEVRFWVGEDNNFSGKYLENIPKLREVDLMETIPPSVLTYRNEHIHRYILRAYLYQGRTVLGSDSSGLSDPFVRLIFGQHVATTRIIDQTRSPVWNQMFHLDGIEMCQSEEELRRNKPVILLNVFDKDKDKEEFLGHAAATPCIIGRAQRDKMKPSPPKLQWFPITIGDKRYGEILACFELYSAGSSCIPQLPLAFRDKSLDGRTEQYLPLPKYIKPKMKSYRLEVLFWGVRELKKGKIFLPIKQPYVEADIGYKFELLSHNVGYTMKEVDKIRSKHCNNATNNPNFPLEAFIIDVQLPEDALFLPTITFKVFEKNRLTDNETLIGTNTSPRISKFLQDPHKYQYHFKDTDRMSRKITIDSTESFDEIKDSPKKTGFLGWFFSSNEKDVLKKGKAAGKGRKVKQKRRIVNQSQYDWWSRYYESIRDLEDKERKEEPNVPRIEIYQCELEKMFNDFSDFLTTFAIRTGKQDETKNRGRDQIKGKFKASIRLWRKHQMKENDHKYLINPRGTFQYPPSNKPKKILVRVYCVAAMDLNAQDSDGKADPYVQVKLGDCEAQESETFFNTLNPEFGKCFEFTTAVLPFDNLLKIRVYDKDYRITKRLIGQTEIDIENRYFSKHRPTYGLAKRYFSSGFAQWRDSSKPSEIYEQIFTRDHHGKKPDVKLPSSINKQNEEEVENFFLKKLHDYKKHHGGDCGYELVPEHIETRPLYNHNVSSLPQGKLLMWVDICDRGSHLSPMPPINITPRKPKEYELRVIVWNCEGVPLTENSMLLGARSSDIRFQGWIEGHPEKYKRTDVHWRSTDGSGMFNWRFKYNFKYHQAKRQIVRKETVSVESTC